MKNRTFFLAFLALALFSSALAIGQDGKDTDKTVPRVTFGAKAAAVGDRYTEQSREGLDLKATYTVDGKVIKDIDQKTLKISDTRIEVLEVTGDNIQKLKVEFKKIVIQGRARGGAPVTEDGLSGRWFTVTQTGRRLRVLEGESKAVPPEDAEWVRSEVSSLFRDSGRRLGLAVPPRGIRFGERIMVAKTLATRLFDFSREDFEIISLILILKRRERVEGAECGVFSVEVKGKSRNSVPAQTLKLRGEVHVDIANGRQRRLRLKGPILFKGKEKDAAGTIEVRGKGSMTVNRGSAFSRPDSKE